MHIYYSYFNYQNMNEPIVVSQTMQAPVQNVWQALTDKTQMKEWYFDLEDFKAEEGFSFTFEGGPEDRVYLHMCTITEVVPLQKLSYSWRYKGYDGDTVVTFLLQAQGPNQTTVTLTHSGIESFGNSNSDLARHNFEQGWTDIITRSLKNFVEQD